MKIGIITDIHSNIIALEAILKELDKEGCEKNICSGGIVGIGPRPEETVRRIMEIPYFCAVKGNHKKYLWENTPKYNPMMKTWDPKK